MACALVGVLILVVLAGVVLGGLRVFFPSAPGGAGGWWDRLTGRVQSRLTVARGGQGQELVGVVYAPVTMTEGRAPKPQPGGAGV